MSDTTKPHTAQGPGLFSALQLEVRPCLAHILGCVGLLRAEIERKELSDLIPDLEKIGKATHVFLDSFHKLIDDQGMPAQGADARKIRHELRTPVGHMVGYAEMLLEELDGGVETLAISADIERLLKSARQLLALVNESLNISGAASGQPQEPAPAGSRAADSHELGQFVSADVLVVDDNEANRELLTKYLAGHGLNVSQAQNGKVALQKMEGASFDLVLLDVMMPEMDGYQVLAYMKEDPGLRHIPVIMISAIDELENVVTCIGMGAADYLSKPFNPVLLHARVQACLERKRWRDQEQNYLQQLEVEQAKSEMLLLNILPSPIAGRLKRQQTIIADNFQQASVLFADIIGFTNASARLAPATLVKSLNILFTAYDALADRYGVEKIKTIGDAYMAASGLPIPRDDHAQALVDMALDMLEETERVKPKLIHPFDIRVGVCSGPVTAGVIGKRKFCYDLWGDTVNTSSRMSGIGDTPHVRVTESTFELVKGLYRFGPAEFTEVKGKGKLASYTVLGRES